MYRHLEIVVQVSSSAVSD